MVQYASIAPNEICLIIITDIDLNITFCSELLCQLALLSKESVLKKSVTQLPEWLPREKCLKAVDEVAKNKCASILIDSSEEINYDIAKSGLIWEVCGLRNQECNLTGFLFRGIFNDDYQPVEMEPIGKKEVREKSGTPNLKLIDNNSISEKNSDEILRKSEQQFRYLSENVPGAVYEFIFQRDGTYGFKFLSPVITKMFGISVKKFSSSFDHIHPDDLERLLLSLQHASQTYDSFYFEGRLITPTGDVKWHSASSSFSYFTREGGVVFTGIIQDITTRKLAEERLLYEEGKFRQILSKLGDNAWEHNFLTHETQFSDAIYELAGRLPKDLKANADLWWNSIHPDDRWIMEEGKRKYKTGQQDSHSLEYRIFHVDGSIKWILDRGVVLDKTDDGFPIRVAGTHTDITKEVELREKLLVHEQQKKKEILQAVLMAQERERQEIAYELHENVSQVLTGCQLILGAELLNKNKDKNTQSLENVIQHIKYLINEVRNINYTLSTATLQLLGLHQAMEVFVSKINSTSNISFEMNTANYDPVESYDDIDITLFRIMQEQVQNIIRHSGATKAMIVLKTSATEFFLEITDNGKGFDVQAMQKGLGFVNIYSRVENYNGKILLNSKPGNGCTLRIIIPATKA